MSRDVKRMMIDSIQMAIGDARDFLVVDVSRVSAESVNRIRLNLAEQRIRLICVRNAVASRALSDLGLECAAQVLVGPSALVFGGEDISSVSKEIAKCAEQDKGFEIKSGIAEGAVLSREDVDLLIKSPGRMELLSQLSACIVRPGIKLASTLSNSYGLLASQIDRVSRQ